MTNKKRVVYDVTLLFSVFINMIFFTYFFHQHLRTLSSLTGLRGAPEVPPLCRETQSLGQQMSDVSRHNGGTRISTEISIYNYRYLYERFYIFSEAK